MRGPPLHAELYGVTYARGKDSLALGYCISRRTAVFVGTRGGATYSSPLALKEDEGLIKYIRVDLLQTCRLFHFAWVRLPRCRRERNTRKPGLGSVKHRTWPHRIEYGRPAERSPSRPIQRKGTMSWRQEPRGTSSRGLTSRQRRRNTRKPGTVVLCDLSWYEALRVLACICSPYRVCCCAGVFP